MSNPTPLLFSFVTVLAAFTTAAFSQNVPGNPLNGLEQLKSYETMRVSSSDPNWKDGNSDSRPIKPGGTLTLAELDGPGMIAHIWVTIAHDDPFYPRKLTLRMYWDGEEHPSVECPFGDFFGMGHGIDKPFTSLPIRVTSEGRGRNCYWPMPFRKKARITVTNDSDQRCNNFYYYIDWQKHASLPADTAYFHGMYRQEFPCVMGRNYLIADIEGRGHYVGTIQSFTLVSPGWYGEGNDYFFIDGEKEPRLRGTGTEDYFCDGWGFRQQAGPFYGTPLYEGYDTGDRGTAYRFHIPDPVTFTKTLQVEIQHKGSQSFPDGTGTGFIERDDLMSSVAFWYQTEPHKVWPALPPGDDRLPFRDRPVLKGHELLSRAKHSQHPLEVQSFSGATDGQQLWFKPADGKGWMEVSFEIAKEQPGELLARMFHSWDYGNYRVRLDGEEIGQLKLYDSVPRPSVDKLGKRRLTAGPHTLRFECMGKDEKSAGYFLGFDALLVRTPVYSRPASVDLRSLQKK
jgi:hypothetical protein